MHLNNLNGSDSPQKGINLHLCGYSHSFLTLGFVTNSVNPFWKKQALSYKGDDQGDQAFVGGEHNS